MDENFAIRPTIEARHRYDHAGSGVAKARGVLLPPNGQKDCPCEKLKSRQEWGGGVRCVNNVVFPI